MNISRSQWYRRKIKNFLDSNESQLSILLYSREIKCIKKLFGDIPIAVGETVSSTDKRKFCRILK